MLTVGNLAGTATEFLAIWALFARFGSLRGWTLPEIALFFGVTDCAFALAEGIGRGFDTFSNLVKNGDFDRLLVRPRSTLLQVAGQELLLTRLGRLVEGAAVLVWAAVRLRVGWSAPHVALLIGAIVGGACLFYGLLVLQATLSFWTIETLELFNILTYGGIETARFPLTVYRPWLRRFFTLVVPLACFNYLPLGQLLGPPHSAGVSPVWQWTAPFAGILFLLICLQIWKIGVRHYCSTGS